MEETSSAAIATESLEGALRRQVARAAEEGQRYAVLAVAPQHLPGERSPEIVHAVAGRLLELVRATDLSGMLNDEALVFGIEDADRVSAAVLADRLQNGLRLRTLHLQNTAWEAGIACMPEDGTTADELLTRAIADTQTRRRRLAAL